MTGGVRSLGAWRGGQLFRCWPGSASRSPDLQMGRKAHAAPEQAVVVLCLSVVTAVAAASLTVIPGLVPGLDGRHISRQVKSTGLLGHSEEPWVSCQCLWSLGMWVTRKPGRPVPGGKLSTRWARHWGCSPVPPGDNKDSERTPA